MEDRQSRSEHAAALPSRSIGGDYVQAVTGDGDFRKVGNHFTKRDPARRWFDSANLAEIALRADGRRRKRGSAVVRRLVAWYRGRVISTRRTALRSAVVLLLLSPLFARANTPGAIPATPIMTVYLFDGPPSVPYLRSCE